MAILRRIALGLLAPLLAACAMLETAPDRGVTVGVLLPTDARDPALARLGGELANAAALASADLDGASVNVLVFPTAGTPEQAARAALAARNAGAGILLGPLFADETRAAAPIAEASELKLLSLADTVEPQPGVVYTIGMSPDTVARRITENARADGLRRFGIVYQNTQAGRAGRDAVRQALADTEGQVLLELGYRPGTAVITRRISDIAAAVRSSDIDALIFTDAPEGRLAFVTEALRGRGIRPGAVRFFGLTAWNRDPDGLARPGLQGGRFAAPDPALLNRFEERYTAAYGAAPPDEAALVYDGIAAVGALVADAQGEDPFSRDRLEDRAGFAGVNGIFRLRSDGGIDRALTVFEVSLGTARAIDPAPRRFSTPGS